MNRRAFLKKAALLGAAAVVVPKVLFAGAPETLQHKKRILALARAMGQTKYHIEANILNRSFSGLV